LPYATLNFTKAGSACHANVNTNQNYVSRACQASRLFPYHLEQHRIQLPTYSVC